MKVSIKKYVVDCSFMSPWGKIYDRHYAMLAPSKKVARTVAKVWIDGFITDNRKEDDVRPATDVVIKVKQVDGFVSMGYDGPYNNAYA